jgi:hypothetical protein
MKHTNEQFNQLLEGAVEGERIDPVFQSALIDSLEHSMHKKKRFWARPFVPAAIVGVLFIGVVTTALLTDLVSPDPATEVAEVDPFGGAVFDSLSSESADDTFEMTPWRVPTDWEQEHVSYVAAEGFTLPEDISRTVDYGSLEDILDYITWNAYFPAIMWGVEELPEVDVQYEIVGWKMTEVGLSLKAQMTNFPEVRDAFDGVDVRSLRERWVSVPLPEERAQLRSEIDAYKQLHPEE